MWRSISFSGINIGLQRIRLGWHRDLPEFAPASALRSLKEACLANMGLAGRAAEAAEIFHPADAKVR